MLVGLNAKDNKTVSSYRGDISYIEELVNNNLLICPSCKANLVYKNGDINIQHFAHKNGYKCTYKYYEKDTKRHILSKLKLAERLKRLYPYSRVLLEHKLDVTEQFSDIVLIHPNGEKWAFEIVLDRIPREILLERDKLYEKAGVQVFWFLGFNYNKYKEEVLFNILKEFSILANKSYSIYIENNEINISKDYSSTTAKFRIEKLIIKKESDKYLIKNEDFYKIPQTLYTRAKEDFFIYLKQKYYACKAYKDFQINKQENEIADIVLIRKKDEHRFIFNFVYANTVKDVIRKRKLLYEKDTDTVFWILGEHELYSRKFIGGKGICDKYRYLLKFENSNWSIKCSKSSGKEFYVSLSMLKIGKDINDELYVLNSINGQPY